MNQVELYTRTFVYKESKYETISSDFSYDGEVYCTSSADNTYRIFSVDNPHNPTIFNSEQYGTGLIKFTHHPNVIFTSFNNRGILNSMGLLCFEKKSFIRLFNGHTDEIISIDQNNSSDMMMSTSLDDHLILWDPRFHNPCCSNTLYTNSPIGCFSGDGTKVIVQSDNKLNVFDLRKYPYEPLFQIGIPSNKFYRKIVCSLDDNKIAVSASSGQIVCIENYKEKDPKIGIIASKTQKDSPAIEFTPDSSRLLFSDGFDGSINSYEFEKKSIATFTHRNQTTVTSIKCNIKYPIISTCCSVVNWLTYTE